MHLNRHAPRTAPLPPLDPDFSSGWADTQPMSLEEEAQGGPFRHTLGSGLLVRELCDELLFRRYFGGLS